MTGIVNQTATVTALGTPALTAEFGATNMRLRKWDGANLPTATTATVLEEGITATFASTTYGFRTGQYWMVPARTELGALLSAPSTSAPDGPTHHYVPLAYVTRTLITDESGTSEAWSDLVDLRRKFLSAVDAPTLLKVDGDLQRGVPGPDVELPVQLKVAVGRRPGEWVTFATDFTVPSGNTLLTSATGAIDDVTWYNEVSVQTGDDGTASVRFRMPSTLATTNPKVKCTWGVDGTRQESVTFTFGFIGVPPLRVVEFWKGAPNATESARLSGNLIRRDAGTPPAILAPVTTEISYEDSPVSVLSQGANEVSTSRPNTDEYLNVKLYEDTTALNGIELGWDKSSIRAFAETWGGGSYPALEPLHGPVVIKIEPSDSLGRTLILGLQPSNGPSTSTNGRILVEVCPKAYYKLGGKWMPCSGPTLTLTYWFSS